jgi:hypothetical protein
MLNLDEGSASPRVKPRPITLRSALAVAALVVNAGVSALMVREYAWRLDLLRRVQAHQPVERADLVASDSFIALGSTMILVCFVLTAIAFLAWFYRAQQNLRAFRAEPFEFTPSQAVWSFFIPFVNLVRPYSVMREVWQASDPSLPPFAETPHPTPGGSPLVLAWWLLFLGRGVIGWAALVPLAAGRTVETLTSSARVMMLCLALSVGAALVAASLVVRVMKRQQRLARILDAVAA